MSTHEAKTQRAQENDLRQENAADRTENGTFIPEIRTSAQRAPFTASAST